MTVEGSPSVFFGVRFYLVRGGMGTLELLLIRLLLFGLVLLGYQTADL